MTDKNYWIQKWKDKDIRFHQESTHPHLLRFSKNFPRGSILVPLCGKSLDLIHLASLGHETIGVELSEIACRDFFLENKLSCTERSIPGFKVFSSENITLYCGDFFELPQDVWKSIIGIYDRAAIVALPEKLRNKYAIEIVTKTPKGSEILLIAFDYPDGILQGPPFSVPESELRKIFKGCDLKLIDTRKDAVRTTDVSENAYWIVVL